MFILIRYKKNDKWSLSILAKYKKNGGQSRVNLNQPLRT